MNIPNPGSIEEWLEMLKLLAPSLLVMLSRSSRATFCGFEGGDGEGRRGDDRLLLCT